MSDNADQPKTEEPPAEKQETRSSHPPAQEKNKEETKDTPPAEKKEEVKEDEHQEKKETKEVKETKDAPAEKKEGDEQKPVSTQNNEAVKESQPKKNESEETKEAPKEDKTEKEKKEAPPVEQKKAAPVKKAEKEPKKKVKKVINGEEVEVEEEEEEEEEEILMGENEFYPENYVDKELPDSTIPKKYSKYHGWYGVESLKRFNIHLIEPYVLIYANGNIYELYDMKEKSRKILFGKDTDGIGSICVHPSRKYFAVAEKGTFPNINIYDYPDLKLYRICKNGTEKAYSHIEFSTTGEKLVSVGSAPDYTITVWNWKAQKVVLKSKAFAQEVYRVSFSPYTDGVLVTSGMGHIKFWKMANTFTGLKLQGELGKFGKLELSDVTGFRELPDGKVVSGTEYGTMILWEGRNIKAHLVRNVDTKEPLHKGFLEIVLLYKEEFITAGQDGYIRFWKFQDIDTAEFSDELMEVAIIPTREIYVGHEDGTPAHINQMLKEGDRWILGDARGRIWEINLDTEDKFEVMNFHSGPIADLGVCPKKNVAVTLGSDGIVKWWDFINEKELFSRMFPGNGTCLDWLPYTDQNKGRIFACGYSTGVARVFSIESDRFKLLNSVKSLDWPMVKIKYSPDGYLLATVGKDGSIFFFETTHDKYDWLDPICMWKIESEINDCTWDSNSKKFMVWCKNGRVYEINKPNKNEVNVKESFMVELKYSISQKNLR